MSALRKLLTAVVALLVCSCSPALAGPTLVTNAYPLVGSESLALAGPATLVAGIEGGKADLVRSFAPGRSPVVLARVHPDGEGAGQIDLAGSPSRIGLLERGISSGYKGCCSTFYRSVATAALGGPVTTLTAGCHLAPTIDDTAHPEAGIQANTTIALDGEVMAYDSFGCLVVHDFASGLQRIVPLQATLDPVYQGTIQDLEAGELLRVAGRYVAYRANQLGGEGAASVVVYNIDTGSELYRVPLLPYMPPILYPGPFEQPPTFGLESDGTLVIADSTSCSAMVSTIAHPSPLPLGIAACAVEGVRDGRALIVTPGAERHLTLAWTPLVAPLAHPIADLGTKGVLQTTIPVMDERNVVYALNGCWAPNVYRASLEDPGSPPTAPSHCPVIVSSSHATLTGKALRVQIRCPLGCEGTLEAFAGTTKELRPEEGGASLRAISPYHFSAAPGRSMTLTFKPGEQEEEQGVDVLRVLNRRLRRRRKLDVRLNFYTQTPAAEGVGSISNGRNAGVAYETQTHVVIPIHLQASVAKSRRRSH